jgi:hypothetical protein
LLVIIGSRLLKEEQRSMKEEKVMKPMTNVFGIDFDPVADPAAVVFGQEARFTVLTERLLRLEYSRLWPGLPGLFA